MTSDRRPRYGLVVFDADSTLADLEGIDWLAGRREPAITQQVVALTDRAMAGGLPLEAVYGERLRIIRPTRREIAALAEAYVAHQVPGMGALVRALREAGVAVHVVSGGVLDALLPLADALGIARDAVHAVQLAFDDDVASGLLGVQPLARQDGKRHVVATLKAVHGRDAAVALIGDGATDAEARPEVDTFIAFTGVVRREAVVQVADAEARDVEALARLLFAPT